MGGPHGVQVMPSNHGQPLTITLKCDFERSAAEQTQFPARPPSGPVIPPYLPSRAETSLSRSHIRCTSTIRDFIVMLAGAQVTDDFVLKMRSYRPAQNKRLRPQGSRTLAGPENLRPTSCTFAKPLDFTFCH